MNTSLQQAAQELIDRWDSPMWRYQQATTDVIAELRKALDAELAQSEPERCGYDETTGNCTKNPCCNLSANQAEPVEPFAYFNIGTEYHVKGKIIFHKGLTPNLEDRWWGPDTPLYLHPPQPQATTPAVPELLEELENCRDLLEIAFPDAPVDSCIGVGIIKASAAIAAAQGEKT